MSSSALFADPVSSNGSALPDIRYLPQNEPISGGGPECGVAAEFHRPARPLFGAQTLIGLRLWGWYNRLQFILASRFSPEMIRAIRIADGLRNGFFGGDLMWFGELILRSLIRLRRRASGKAESYEQYFEWQFQTTEQRLNLFPGLDLKAKSVLEIGCGIGGRIAYVASRGTARSVGIDINAEEIRLAPKLSDELHPEVKDKVEFLVSQEDGFLPIGTFDIVLLIDSMEHVVSPPKILRLAYHYLKNGGRCYFNTMGWYHHNASHTGLFPWVQVLFSDETILNVIRWRASRPDYVPGRFDSNPPIERWRDVYNLRDRPGEYLNKISLAEIKRLTRHTIFRDASMHVIPFQRPGLIGAIASAAARTPILQELLHSGVVVKLVK
jgi:SAM-dependent methyltransferase